MAAIKRAVAAAQPPGAVRVQRDDVQIALAASGGVTGVPTDVCGEGHTDARPMWSLIIGLLIWNDLSNVSGYLRVTSDSGHATSVAIERLLRRLITLIYAGRNRMVVIRRELPRTKRADPARRPAA